MPTNNKLVHHEVITTFKAQDAAKEVCRFLDENRATLICVSQVITNRGLQTTVFYTPGDGD